MKPGFVYIISNNYSNVLYTGVTNNLLRRIQEHRIHFNPKSFSARYNICKLLYYEYFEDIREAIVREKRIKKWNRSWKMQLIREVNPEFRDLYDELV